MKSQSEVLQEANALLTCIENKYCNSGEDFKAIKNRLESLFWVVNDGALSESYKDRVIEALTLDWLPSDHTSPYAFKIGDTVQFQTERYIAKIGHNRYKELLNQFENGTVFFKISDITTIFGSDGTYKQYTLIQDDKEVELTDNEIFAGFTLYMN